MRQKLPLFIGIIAVIVIVLMLIGNKRTVTPYHKLITGTEKVLQPSSSKVDLKKFAVNFYMENSGSMDGYVNGTTEFKDVLGKMIVSSHHYCRETGFYFVNKDVYEVNGAAINFIQMLNPSKIKVGNVGSTDINQIYRNILERTKKHTISVLFSDCIYSVSNVTNELDNAKNATTDAFLTALSRDPSLASIILQFSSSFSGMYYDRNDHPYPCTSARPYYVVITGNRNAVKQIYQDFKVASLPGLKNKCFLSSESWTLDSSMACTIISDYTNARRIKTNKQNFLDIDEIKLVRDLSTLQFGVGIDFSNIFLDPSYITDASNYYVEPNNYKVKSVVCASASAKGDFSNAPKLPYAITVEVPVTSFAPMITVGLKKNIPSWVSKANVDDDIGGVPPSNKSFAIKKMIEGIAAAYSTDYDSYFKLEININKYDR